MDKSSKFERLGRKKEKKETAEQIKAEMAEYTQGLKALGDEKQEELNQLLDIPREKRDDAKIVALKKELADIDAQVAEMDESLTFMAEAGDELEVKIKEL